MSAHMRVQPQWPARGPAAAERARIDPIVYVREARRLQAQTMAETIGAGWRGLGRALSGVAAQVRRQLFAPVARRSVRRRALAYLRALDDRLLADIGLRRGDIELAVDGLLDDPRVTRRAPASPAVVTDRLRKGERCPAPVLTANSNQAPAQPNRVTELAA